MLRRSHQTIKAVVTRGHSVCSDILPAKRRPVLPDICGSGTSRAFFWPGSLSISACYSAEDAHCEGIAAAVIEDACRGIDVEDSVAATRKTFAALDIPCISVETVG